MKNSDNSGKKLWMRIAVLLLAVIIVLGIIILPLI
jgi:cytochrome b subunit of formate dehydrogenase